MFLLDYRTRAPASPAALPPVLSRSTQHPSETRSHSEPAVSLAGSVAVAKGTVSALAHWFQQLSQSHDPACAAMAVRRQARVQSAAPAVAAGGFGSPQT